MNNHQPITDPKPINPSTITYQTHHQSKPINPTNPSAPIKKTKPRHQKNPPRIASTKQTHHNTGNNHQSRINPQTHEQPSKPTGNKQTHEQPSASHEQPTRKKPNHHQANPPQHRPTTTKKNP